MARAIMTQNRLRSREKVLVFFEGKPNLFPCGDQEKGVALKETSRDRKADKFWMGLNAWKARGLFHGSNRADDSRQINR